jgi:phospholipid transport system substrate-binding protein
MKGYSPVKILSMLFACAFLCLSLQAFAQEGAAAKDKAVPSAGSPLNLLQDSVNRILDILKGPDYKDAAKKPELRNSIYAIVDSQFNWQEMSQRALGRNWKEQSKENQDKFVGLFSQLLKKTYIDKVEGYSGEKITYEVDPQDDPGSTVVKTQITQPSGAIIPVVYRMAKKDSGWLVYDVVIEGVSLIKNYRSQFSEMLSGSSFEELLKKLEDKVQRGETAPEKTKL